MDLQSLDYREVTQLKKKTKMERFLGRFEFYSKVVNPC